MCDEGAPFIPGGSLTFPWYDEAMTLADLPPAQKNDMIISLAALLLENGGSALTAENLSDVVKATGNEIPSYYPTLFAAFLEKSEGCAAFCKMTAGGGGGGGGGDAEAAPVVEEKKEEEEEEEEIDMGGGMDMFGGGDEGGDY